MIFKEDIVIKVNQAVAYYNARPGCATTGVCEDGGGQILLMDDGNKHLLIKTDNESILQWQKGYSNLSGNPVPGELMPAPGGGYYFFMSDRYDLNAFHLQKTNAATSIECAKDTVQMVAEDAIHSLNIILSGRTNNNT